MPVMSDVRCPDLLAVAVSPDVPGYLEVHEGGMNGPVLATVLRSGPPGATGRPSPGGLAIGAPIGAPAGSRRPIIGPDGAWAGYIEYRSNLSVARCVTALVGPDDAGVLAWTRERSATAALIHRLRPGSPIPPTALMIGQNEAAEIDSVRDGYVLRWGTGPRLSARHAALIAAALALPR
jgi:hypothetical protein